MKKRSTKRRAQYDYQAAFETLRSLLGEQAIVSIRERERTREELTHFSKRMEKTLSERRPAFVWGVGEVRRNGSEIGGTTRVTFGGEPIWMTEGDKQTFFLESYAAIHEIRLRVESPFLIRGVCLGNQMQTVSHNGVFREVEFSGPFTPGNRLRVDVEWPSEWPV